MHRRSGIELKLLRTALTAVFSALMLLTIVVPLGAYTPAPQPSAPVATRAEPATARQSGEEAKTKEAKEAEDETQAFRHSAAVRWIARLTGLSADAAYWLCVVLNFAIVVGALWVPLRKRLPGIFKSRTDSIQQRLEEARKTSEEARTRLAEVEDRLSRLDAEIAGMRREAEENARAEERRVMAEADEERRRIVAAAEQEITSAANAARRDLKAYAGELAVDLAGKKIQVGKDQDQVLVREFTSQLGKDGH